MAYPCQVADFVQETTEVAEATRAYMEMVKDALEKSEDVKDREEANQVYENAHNIFYSLARDLHAHKCSLERRMLDWQSKRVVEESQGLSMDTQGLPGTEEPEEADQGARGSNVSHTESDKGEYIALQDPTLDAPKDGRAPGPAQGNLRAPSV